MTDREDVIRTDRNVKLTLSVCGKSDTILFIRVLH